MRFLVIGAGAVGCLVGGRLAAAGHDVTLVARSWLAGTVTDSGLRLNVGGETIYVPEIAAVTTVTEAVHEFGPFDLALFTMKSYDTQAAVRELQATVSHPPRLLSLQNGVGNEQQLSSAFGRGQVIAGAITSPAEMPVPGVIRASPGAVGLAALDPDMPLGPVAGALRSSGFPTRIYADWRALKWSKLLLNMLGNATAAILDWPPGRVFGDGRLFEVEWQAWQEALAVMEAQGVQVVALPGYPLPWVRRAMRWMPRSLLQAGLARVMADGRGGKMPSLHIDLSKGKPDSEITVLNGAVAGVGRRLGIPTPVNAALTDTLMDIARKRLAWDSFRGRPNELLAVVAARHRQREQVGG